LAANLKNAKKLVDYGFVRSQTVEKASQAFKDPKLSESQKIRYLYSIGFEFGGHVLNNYWLLKPNLLAKIDSYARQNFNQNYVIGIQLRFEFLNQSDIDAFVKCAYNLEATYKEHLGNQIVKWYISSDQSSFIQDLIKIYPGRILSGEGQIGHTAENQNNYERSLFDIELLSRCNETILTGGSTFGFISSIKSQKRPYYVEGQRGTKDCKQLDFSAPARNPSGFSIF